MRSMPSTITFAAFCWLTLGAAAPAFAGPAAAHLPVAVMTADAVPAAPVDNAAFLPGTDAAAAAPLVGTLRIAQSPMRALPELNGPVVGGRDARLFPALTLQLFSDGGTLVPVQRGQMIAENPAQTARGAQRSYWTVIPQIGRVWREPGDGEWSRAALPLMLRRNTAPRSARILRHPVRSLSFPFPSSPTILSVFPTGAAAFTAGRQVDAVHRLDGNP